jgi:hypothetical protein
VAPLPADAVGVDAAAAAAAVAAAAAAAAMAELRPAGRAPDEPAFGGGGVEVSRDLSWPSGGGSAAGDPRVSVPLPPPTDVAGRPSAKRVGTGRIRPSPSAPTATPSPVAAAVAATAAAAAAVAAATLPSTAAAAAAASFCCFSRCRLASSSCSGGAKAAVSGRA